MSVYALPLDSSGIAPGGESRGSFFLKRYPVPFVVLVLSKCLNQISFSYYSFPIFLDFSIYRAYTFNVARH